MIKKLLIGWYVSLTLSLLVVPLSAKTMIPGNKDGNKKTPNQPLTAALPVERRVHNVGNFWLMVTNNGIFGSQSGSWIDPCTRESAPSAEFPGGSGVNYLFQGALWVAGILGEGSEAETLVSVGNEGWYAYENFIPTAPLRARTIRPSGLQQGTCLIDDTVGAVSEQDYIVVYADTCYDASLCEADPVDGPHVPLGLEVTQKSYNWSYDYAQDFILFDFLIRNINVRKINNAYIGLYVDADNHNTPEDPSGFQDDVSGFLHTVPAFRCADQFSDTLDVAWTGDNDGLSNARGNKDNQDGVYITTMSPTSLAGTRVVRAPGEVKTSFNWWQSDGNNPALDWGPWTLENYQKWQEWGDHTLGTPIGNISQYRIMSNGEFDYDQLSACLPWTDSGWIDCPVGLCTDVADGYDTRYLLSFGPFNINPGETLPLTLAYLAGADFHIRPSDWGIFNGKCTDQQAFRDYMAAKDFTDFATNARWAGWVYDNPGIDTDNDGYKGKFFICEGESVYYEGDSIPDFKGPPPPDAPKLRFETSQGTVIVRWNGMKTETTPDKFSGVADLEGYRIYISRTGFPESYSLLASHDKVDYKMYVYNPGNQKWSLKLASITADSLAKLFAQDNICCYSDGLGGCVCETTSCTDPDAFGTDPLKWTFDTPYVYQDKGLCLGDLEISPALTIRVGDKVAFEPQDWNILIDAIKDSVALGKTPQDSEYYEYKFTIDSLSPCCPVYIAVTAFDFGNPQTNLAPLETSPLVNATQVWPLAAPPTGTIGKKVVVYPNPYKITETYFGENRSLPAGKLIHFRQLPGECTINIFTLDGDRVATIRNDDPNNSDITWNLISSNNQEVVAGIYIFHVESKSGNQIGKFAVIK